jgi:hypothetical protein
MRSTFCAAAATDNTVATMTKALKPFTARPPLSA